MEPESPHFEGWDIVEKLGEGGMCAVYRVKSLTDEPERAIKVLVDKDPSAAERFADEGILLRRIEHPNIVKIHAIHDQTSPPWLLMDLLAGRDLEEARQEGPMRPALAAQLFADVAAGLAAVHAQGVRHRDIKPANIMLGEDGIPRLVDFGIARETSKAHVTRKGFVVGTAAYLPPEIFLEDDSREIQDSEVSDVYALGQSLCEVLTGQSVHPTVGQHGNDATLLMSVMKDKLEHESLDPRRWVSTIPAGLCEVVMAATAQEPDERIPSASLLEARLRSWLEKHAQAPPAPLTSIDPTQLPDPTPAGVPRLGTHTEAPLPRATAAPAPSRTGGVVKTAAAGALSTAGISAVTAAIAAVALLGVAVLWWFAPGASEPRGLSDAAAAAAVDFGTCHGSGATQWELRVAKGKASSVRLVQGSATSTVRGCVEKAMKKQDWPDGTYTARIPVLFP